MKTTNIRLSDEDWNYCKVNKLMFSNLLRHAIALHKETEQPTNSEVLAKKLEVANDARKRLLDFIEKNKLSDAWMRECGF